MAALIGFVVGLIVGAGLMRLRDHYGIVSEQERARRNSRIAWLATSQALRQLEAIAPALFRRPAGSRWN